MVVAWGETEVPYPSTVTDSRPLALVLGEATERAMKNSVSIVPAATLATE